MGLGYERLNVVNTASRLKYVPLRQYPEDLSSPFTHNTSQSCLENGQFFSLLVLKTAYNHFSSQLSTAN